MNQKILFIDRDGTIIDEPKITFRIDSLKKLSFEPDVIPSLLKLKKLGYKFIMISNQDGLGTEIFPKKSFDLPHKFMLETLSSQGIIFEEILICPHTLEENCLCRKPKTKLVKKWLKKDILDKSRSYVIGDRITDIYLAKKMGIHGLKYNRKNLNWKKISKIIIKKNRYALIKRKSKETIVKIQVWLDCEGKNKINTGIKFFDHMLEQICIHGNFLSIIKVIGDLYIDDHHTVEDTAISFGKAILKALDSKIGINRFGCVIPMDESIAKCILDISNRPYFSYKANFKYQKVGDLSSEMIEHFFRSLSYSMSISLHLETTGKNDHHIAESLFKAFGYAIRQAILINRNTLPSSKGIL